MKLRVSRRLRLPRGLAPLAHRDFRLYWMGFAPSTVGTWAELTGVVWLAYEVTESPALVGLLGLVRAVPVVVCSPLAGVLADRIDQRKFLLWLQALACALSLSLGLLVVAGRLEVWHLFVQAGAQAGTKAFDASVRQTMYPRLIPRSVLVAAVTLHSAGSRSGQLFGPALGGLAISHLGVAAPFLINAATYFFLIIAVALIRPLEKRPTSDAKLRSDLRQGMRAIRSNHVLRGIINLELVFSLFQMNPVMVTIVAREVLDVGPEALGGLLSASAFGGMIGIALLVAVRPTIYYGRFVLVCTLTYAGVLVGFAISQTYTVSFLLLALIGLLDAAITVTRLSLTHLAAPEGLRGRVIANVRMVSAGTSPLSQTQSGLLAAHLGVTPAILLAAGALIVGASVVHKHNPSLWSFTHT